MKDNRKLHILLLAMLLMVPLMSVAQHTNRSAKLATPQSAQVLAGKEFAVMLTLTNFDAEYDLESALKAHKFTNCTFKSAQMVNQQTSTMTINGRTSVDVSYIYQLVFAAKGKGICEIGPLDLDGVATNQVKVMSISEKQAEKQRKELTQKPAKNDRITFYLVPYISNKNPKVGETVEYELRLLYPHGTVIGETSMQVLQQPEFEDFDVQPCRLYGTPTGSMEYKGKNYAYTVISRWLLVPLKEKSLIVRGGEFQLTVVPTSVVQGFFGPEYIPDYQRSYSVELKALPIRVKAKGFYAPTQKPNNPTPSAPMPQRRNEPEGPVYHI